MASSTGEQDDLRCLLGALSAAVQLSVDVEPRFGERGDQVLRVVAVVGQGHGVPVRAGAFDAPAVAGLEGCQQPSTRLEYPGELAGACRQPARGSVDEGVPRQQPIQGGVRDG